MHGVGKLQNASSEVWKYRKLSEEEKHSLQKQILYW